MKRPEWLLLRPTGSGDWAVHPALDGGPCACMGSRQPGGVGAPRPHLPHHHGMGPTLVWRSPIVLACLLPDDYTRLRRAGGIYLVSVVIYGLMHNLRWLGSGALTGSVAPTGPAELDRPTPTARRLAEASISPNTRRPYSGALRRLDAWLDGRPLEGRPPGRVPRRAP